LQRKRRSRKGTGSPEEALAAAQQEIQAEKDRYLRLYAEFDNYRKRAARDMEDFRKFANENLIREILPVVDNLERAILSSNGNEEAARCIVEGVEMTRKEIVRILERFHVRPVESLGTPFNPDFHEAVGQEESSEHEPNTVVREFQKGYLLHDRLIRPAMVMVSTAKAGEPAESGPDAEEVADAAASADITEDSE